MTITLIMIILMIFIMIMITHSIHKAAVAQKGKTQNTSNNHMRSKYILAIFCPFSQFCEINISLPEPAKQPNTAPNLFQRGVEYSKYEINKRARRS